MPSKLIRRHAENWFETAVKITQIRKTEHKGDIRQWHASFYRLFSAINTVILPVLMWRHAKIIPKAAQQVILRHMRYLA